MNDGFVKSHSAVLRFIFRHCSVPVSTRPAGPAFAVFLKIEALRCKQLRSFDRKEFNQFKIARYPRKKQRGMRSLFRFVRLA